MHGIKYTDWGTGEQSVIETPLRLVSKFQVWGTQL